MQGPFVDPVVEEIRRIRDEHAARFDYDIAAIFEDMKRDQKESGIAVVSLFPNGSQNRLSLQSIRPAGKRRQRIPNSVVSARVRWPQAVRRRLSLNPRLLQTAPCHNADRSPPKRDPAFPWQSELQHEPAYTLSSESAHALPPSASFPARKARTERPGSRSVPRETRPFQKRAVTTVPSSPPKLRRANSCCIHAALQASQTARPGTDRQEDIAETSSLRAHAEQGSTRVFRLSRLGWCP